MSPTWRDWRPCCDQVFEAQKIRELGFIPNVLEFDGIRSIVAGAWMGLLMTSAMVSFEVSWAVELTPRRRRENPFLVVLTTRSLVWLVIIVIGISVPLLTVNQTSLGELTIAAALVINFIGAGSLGPIDLRGVGSSVELLAISRTG
ncbi:MAG TPA: hypothetical protein VLG28_08650 [Acidimicrobiia bacterium]|jgi:hypothetical protein|nr:hypothetical protein [Acidimicrobiia bacterium]